jgi:Ca-activated chloride channel family protein
VTFQRPDPLALAPLAALLFTLAVGAHWRRLRRLAEAYRTPALTRLLPTGIDRFPTSRLLLLVGAAGLIGVAAAGPVTRGPEPPEPPRPLDVALAVDLSLSMTARDATPSRIERVRETIDLLAGELPSVRFSLVTFAGWPYTLVPPTDDPSVIRYFTPSLEPQVVEELDRGNSLSATFQVALDALDSRPTPEARRAIVVFSDGDVYEEQEVVVRAAAEARDVGAEVWVAGIGTGDGAPMALGGSPVLDAGGRPVLARRNEALLRGVAEAGGGRYVDITDDDGVRSLLEALRDVSGDEAEAPPGPFDATALLALLAIPLLLWEGALDAGRGRSTHARSNNGGRP